MVACRRTSPHRIGSRQVGNCGDCLRQTRRRPELEAAPESEHWDPLPGSTGHKATVAPGEDEDDEGRSDNERLAEEGVAEAGRDHMQQASKITP